MATLNSCNFGTGTSGQVLTSNGTGVAPTFQDAGGSGGFSPDYMVGDCYYTAPHIARALAIADTTALSGVVGDILFMPFYCTTGISWDKISVVVQAVGNAGDEVELLIYDNGSDGQPDNLLIESGTLDISGAGIKEATISYAMSSGWYWLGCLVDNNNTGTATIYGFNVSSATSSNSLSLLPRSSATISTDNTSLVSVGAFTIGNATNNPTVTIGTSAPPMIFLRKSA